MFFIAKSSPIFQSGSATADSEQTILLPLTESDVPDIILDKHFTLTETNCNSVTGIRSQKTFHRILSAGLSSVSTKHSFSFRRLLLHNLQSSSSSAKAIYILTGILRI